MDGVGHRRRLDRIRYANGTTTGRPLDVPSTARRLRDRAFDAGAWTWRPHVPRTQGQHRTRHRQRGAPNLDHPCEAHAAIDGTPPKAPVGLLMGALAIPLLPPD